MATKVEVIDEHHYHPPGLQHQFEDMPQQSESVSLAMWMFLVQEIMFFGGLFTAYLVFRYRFPMAFAAGSNHLNAFWGGLNTLVLIVSSLTMALTVYFAQLGNRTMQMVMIVLTMLFGLTFLGVKAIEYTDKYNQGIVPVAGWNRVAKNPAAAAAEQNVPCWEHHEESEESYNNPRGNFEWTDCTLAKKAEDEGILTRYERAGYYSGNQLDGEKFGEHVRSFFWIYFVMTGLHALHMVIGLGIMLWLLFKAWQGTFGPDYYNPVEISGLYWHFVDIVWIFLFPLLYLLGRHFMH